MKKRKFIALSLVLCMLFSSKAFAAENILDKESLIEEDVFVETDSGDTTAYDENPYSVSGIDENPELGEMSNTDNTYEGSDFSESEENDYEIMIYEEDVYDAEEVYEVPLDENLDIYGAGKTINVTNSAYGANGNDTLDDYAAIQAALNLGTSASTSSPLTVVIPKGTYYLSNTLTIYSNTTLSVASDATIIRMNDANGFISGPRTTGGYTALCNVTVSGGIWDGNVTTKDADGYGINTGDLMYFYHGTNITIKDLTLTECCGYHFIELAGVKDSVISNVTCRDYVPSVATKYTGSTEAIQIDYCGEVSSAGAFPFDNTVCKNIEISGCTFINVMGGIGNHHGEYATNGITIKQCNFSNMYGFCVYLDNFTEAAVSNCTASNVTGFILATKTTVTVNDNTASCKFFGVASNMVDISSGSNVILTGNKVTGGGLSTLYVGSSTLTASGNSFSGSNKSTIILDNATVTIKGNTIGKSAGANSTIWAQNNSSGTIESNTITSSSMGIGVSGCKAFSIISNNINNTPDIGIQLVNPLAKTVISKNIISKCNNDGILVGNATSAVEISSNIITEAGKKGIEVQNSSSTTIKSNTISTSLKEGIHIINVTGTITGNTISISGTHGIMGSGKVSILNNTISGSTYYDINLYDDANVSTSGTIKDNRISGDQTKLISAPTRMTITGNSTTAAGAGTNGSGSSGGYTGMKQVNGTWYYFRNGAVDTTYTGMASYGNTWYYVQAGVLRWGYNGMVQYGSTWYYVQNSTLKWGYTGMVNYSGTWYYVENSTYKSYTGLVNYGGSWYYVQGGVFKGNYTGMVQHGGTWYYVINSKYVSGCTGMVNYAGTWYYIKDSVYNSSYNGVMPYNGQYYYLTNGALKWGVNTLAQYGDKWYYFENSTLNLNYTGNFTYKGKVYRVVRGVVQF